ncbi:SrpA-related protein [hydrothermal vent metagenome]|uniref:SrpA-related protein n=1 Tax=hydrothermal vent metagenome TaxID=652676 RepID=A0A160TFT4_9ZZZZ
MQISVGAPGSSTPSGSLVGAASYSIDPSLRPSLTGKPATNESLYSPDIVEIGSVASAEEGAFVFGKRKESDTYSLTPKPKSVDSEDASAEASSDSSSQTSADEAKLAELNQLRQRDLEVRSHEQAHASVGGELAGSASFTFEQGPDGARYAVAGEVSIDVSQVSGNPEATLAKMQQVRRAALAPAEPSAQDRRVAAMATQRMAEARSELVQQQQDLLNLENSKKSDQQTSLDAELKAAKKTQKEADEGGNDEQERISAAERFAEFNVKLRRINETLLRITQPPVVQAGSLLDDEA